MTDAERAALADLLVRQADHVRTAIAGVNIGADELCDAAEMLATNAEAAAAALRAQPAAGDEALTAGVTFYRVLETIRIGRVLLVALIAARAPSTEEGDG